MGRKALLVLLCLVLAFNFTACTGYNGIMYKHLSNVKNYRTYEITIEKIYVVNKETEKLEEYDQTVHDEGHLNATVYFGISELDGFYGGEYILNDGSKTDNIVLLRVLAENSKILVENDFYNNFSRGAHIEIQVSNWVYMDTKFYYVIGVQCGDIQYLKSGDGLRNVVDMMDKDRSLF